MPELGNTIRYTLRKSEKLCSKRSFDLLIKNRNAVFQGAIQFIFLKDHPADLATAPMMVAFTAPKKKFKKAVHRNLLKRRMKEAYRLHKADLVGHLIAENKFVACLIRYQATEIRSFKQIEADMVKALARLKKQV